jgi:multidrug efflux system membrane fusion protein
MGLKTLTGLGLLGCAAAGAFFFAGDAHRVFFGQTADASQAATPAAPAALRTVRITHPVAAPETTSLSLSGRTAPAEHAMVSSRATGIVTERFVDIGDRVEAGAPLLRIEAPEIEQELARASAVVGQIEVRLELADLELERAENLVTKGHVSVQTKDSRYAAKKTAEADLVAAQAEVKRLREILSFQDVRAPFAGTIVERRVERGNKIVATQSQQDGYLFRIARMDELRVEVDVPQSAALKVTAGAPTKVTFLELPRESFDADVSRVSGFIDALSGTMRVELLMKNPELRIPAGLNGEVVLSLREDQGTVLVPNNTVLTRNGRQMVAVVDGEDRVRFTPIIVARDLGTQVAVSSGLAPGDRVIVSPNALLTEGDAVDVEAMATASASS